VPLGEHVVGVATLLGVHAVEGEIIDDEQGDGEQSPKLDFIGVVEARVDGDGIVSRCASTRSGPS
jgi:hypothetical protein